MRAYWRSSAGVLAGTDSTRSPAAAGRLRSSRRGRRRYIAVLWRHPLYFLHMYEDFKVRDRWTGEEVHCVYQALIVAIATRHADAVDIKFLADGKPVWIALPHPAWVEYQRRSGKVLTDPLAIQAAGHFLKTAIESGLDGGREIYTLTMEEALDHLSAVLGQRAA